MSLKLKINLILLFFFLLFAAWKVISTVKEAEKLSNKLDKEYKEITLGDSLNNTILSSYYPEEWRGYQFYQYITLDSEKKYHIKIYDCITSDKIYFGDIAKPGVRLIKNKGSDSLTVILPGKIKYIFLLNIKKQE